MLSWDLPWELHKIISNVVRNNILLLRSVVFQSKIIQYHSTYQNITVLPSQFSYCYCTMDFILIPQQNFLIPISKCFKPTKQTNTKAQRQTQEEPLLEFFFTYTAVGGAVDSLYRASRTTQTVKTEIQINKWMALI